MIIKCNLTLSNNKETKSLSLLTIVAEENWNLELCDSDFKKNSKTKQQQKSLLHWQSEKIQNHSNIHIPNSTELFDSKHKKLIPLIVFEKIQTQTFTFQII